VPYWVLLAFWKVAAVRDMPEYQLRWAREFRQRRTDSEALLWEELRGKKLAGTKFRRQRPLGRYIADFCCDAARLVVEIDGSVHALPDQQEYDPIRDETLAAWGYTLLRITTGEIAADLPGVLSRISTALKKP